MSRTRIACPGATGVLLRARQSSPRTRTYPGTSLVMGRSTTYGAPFGEIASLVPGDVVTVLGAQGPVTYVVKDLRRAGDPIPPSRGRAQARPQIQGTPAPAGGRS